MRTKSAAGSRPLAFYQVFEIQGEKTIGPAGCAVGRTRIAQARESRARNSGANRDGASIVLQGCVAEFGECVPG
ncbi:MAG TPA: hypothetical protein VLS87_04665, partial [Woeseiaceae bacterium]|nr:hypothetical protein [Woeseiaceae bacterium]